MKPHERSRARAVADLVEGTVLATVEIAADPGRVFRALAGPEVIDWWVRPGVFDTREWSGEVKVGGRWRVVGMARGQPYALEGEFLEVDPPRRLVHTWHPAGMAAASSTVTYHLEAIAGGTRLTLRHTGLSARDACMNNCLGWEACFEKLGERLGLVPDPIP